MNFEPGYYYHIYNRGNNSQQIFFNRENYLFFLKKMEEGLSPFVSVVAWCLMPDHFHWIVFVKKVHTLMSGGGVNNLTVNPKSRSLNDSIGILLRSYTRAVQKQRNITGTLFQKHTKGKTLVDEICTEPAYWNTAFGTQINLTEGKNYLETCIEYVHQNPVHAGLVKSAEEWEFSSCRDYSGNRPGKLLDYGLLEKEGLLRVTHTLTLRGSQPEGATRVPNLSEGMRGSWNEVIIGIGSNIDAEKNIGRMLKILAEKVEVVQVSSFVKTKPVGMTGQPDFTNGAVKIGTNCSFDELKSILKEIENRLGRDRTAPKFGPRTMDLDIVTWNGGIVDPDYYTRDFLKNAVDQLQ